MSLDGSPHVGLPVERRRALAAVAVVGDPHRRCEVFRQHLAPPTEGGVVLTLVAFGGVARHVHHHRLGGRRHQRVSDGRDLRVRAGEIEIQPWIPGAGLLLLGLTLVGAHVDHEGIVHRLSGAGHDRVQKAAVGLGADEGVAGGRASQPDGDGVVARQHRGGWRGRVRRGEHVAAEQALDAHRARAAAWTDPAAGGLNLGALGKVVCGRHRIWVGDGVSRGGRACHRAQARAPAHTRARDAGRRRPARRGGAASQGGCSGSVVPSRP